MPPFLIALGVIGVWLLIPKGRNTIGVVKSTPFNGGIGITTGFAPPEVETGVSVAPQSTQSNAPNTAASGVPAFTSQAQEFNTGRETPIASLMSPSFYNRFTKAAPLTQPMNFSSVRDRDENGMSKTACSSKSDCGCDSCNISYKRSSSSECLAPSSRKQLQNTPKYLVSQWADNINGSKYSMFDVVQQYVNDNGPFPGAGETTPIGIPPGGF